MLALGLAAILAAGCATDKQAQLKADALAAQVMELQETLADVNLRMEEMNSSLFVLRESARNNRAAIKELQEDMQAPTVYIDQQPAASVAQAPELPSLHGEPMAPLPLPTGTSQPSGNDDAAFQSAMKQVEQQNWGLAIYDLNAFATQHPQSAYMPRARFALGDAYRNLGENAQAIREYERCMAAGVAAGPYASRALYWIVICNRQLGQIAKAEAAEKRLLQEFQESPEAKKIKLESPR
jgi:TolA-binding protein